MDDGTKKFTTDDGLPEEVVGRFEMYGKYLAAGKSNYGRADAQLEELRKTCERSAYRWSFLRSKGFLEEALVYAVH